MRSYEDQGISDVLTPEPKMLPSEWKKPEKKAEIIEFRSFKKEIKSVLKESAEVIDFIKEKEKRASDKFKGIIQPEQKAKDRFSIFNPFKKKPTASEAKPLEPIAP